MEIHYVRVLTHIKSVTKIDLSNAHVCTQVKLRARACIALGSSAAICRLRGALWSALLLLASRALRKAKHCAKYNYGTC